MDNYKKKKNVALLSVASNSILIILKLLAGLFIGSISVISEAIHSGVDLIAAIIAFFAVRTANKPPDKGHRFGHGKYENLSGTIEALLIFFAAGWIIYEAIHKLLNPQSMETVGWGVIIMAVSAIVNIIVSHQLFKVGKQTDSLALLADAWHLRTDVYTSGGVAVGLLLYVLGTWLLPTINLRWVDPVVAIMVALLIFKAAYDLTLQSVGGLLDVSLPKEEEAFFIETINSFYPKALSYHNFKTRKGGADRFVEFHLIVEASMSVQDSHDITVDITKTIRDKFPGTTVMIHIEPCEKGCADKCKANCRKQTI